MPLILRKIQHMLTVREIRDETDRVIEGHRKRGLDSAKTLRAIFDLDDRRKALQAKLDGMLAEVNSLSNEIGNLYKQNKHEEAGMLKSNVANLKTESGKLQKEQKEVLAQLETLLVGLPNVPHERVVAGKSAEDNELVRSGGNIPTLPAGAKPHWDICKELDIIDFELGNLLAGSGFPVFKGRGARLERALISYFLDSAVNEGYTEIIPPLMVNYDTAFATGQLPDKEGQMYTIPEDGMYMIPTAEVPITNLYRNRLLDEADLPVKMAGYTPCFRREAGSYGKDVRGLNRVHQFDKVEIVQIQHPDQSYQALEEMVGYVERLIISLELPYRIVRLCGGDMGFTSAMTYDFEVYAAAQQKWLEVSSVSNFETFQSNRLSLRFRDKDNRKAQLHTLNGSALALPRIVAALLENNQDEGIIRIPEVLRTYTGFEVID